MFYITQIKDSNVLWKGKNTDFDTAVSRRVNITLPDAIYEDLEAWADSQGRTIANLAAFIVETEVRNAKKQGQIQTQNDTKK